MSAENRLQQFNPDWVVHPGEILLDELGERIGLDPDVLLGILLGTQPLTEPIAMAISKWSGTSAQLWVNLEVTYRKGLAAGLVHLRDT